MRVNSAFGRLSELRRMSCASVAGNGASAVCMSHSLATSQASRLAFLAGALDALVARCDQSLVEVEGELAELKRLAAADGKRRGEKKKKGSRDPAIYRLGSLFPALGAELAELDDLAALGLFGAGTVGLIWLCEEALRRPEAVLTDWMSAIFADQERYEWCRAWGVIRRWRWCKKLYDDEVTRFHDTPKAKDPDSAWRRKPVSPGQYYLVRQACRMLVAPEPEVLDRGAAYEWLKEAGGNPRFWSEPSQPQQKGAAS